MEKRSRRRIRDLVAHPASQGLDANENRCARISMMARSANAPLKGRIQKRKTNNLQIITSGLQRTAGPYRSAKQTKGWRPANGKPGKGSMTLMATWSAGGGVQWRSAPGYPAFVRAHCPDCASAASLDPHHPAASLPADRFYDRAGVAVIGAPSSSEWPQTIFSGQISSSLDPKTSRIVEAMIHMAMPAAMSGSKME